MHLFVLLLVIVVLGAPAKAQDQPMQNSPLTGPFASSLFCCRLYATPRPFDDLGSHHGLLHYSSELALKGSEPADYVVAKRSVASVDSARRFLAGKLKELFLKDILIDAAAVSVRDVKRAGMTNLTSTVCQPTARQGRFTGSNRSKTQSNPVVVWRSNFVMSNCRN